MTEGSLWNCQYNGKYIFFLSFCSSRDVCCHSSLNKDNIYIIHYYTHTYQYSNHGIELRIMLEFIFLPCWHGFPSQMEFIGGFLVGIWLQRHLPIHREVGFLGRSPFSNLWEAFFSYSLSPPKGSTAELWGVGRVWWIGSFFWEGEICVLSCSCLILTFLIDPAYKWKVAMCVFFCFDFPFSMSFFCWRENMWKKILFSRSVERPFIQRW